MGCGAISSYKGQSAFSCYPQNFVGFLTILREISRILHTPNADVAPKGGAEKSYTTVKVLKIDMVELVRNIVESCSSFGLVMNV